MPAYAFTTYLVLDEAGLRYHRPWRKDMAIPWPDFVHYEVLNNPRAATSTYYLRSRTGVTIPIADTSHNIADIIVRIQARRPFPEQPYQRRAWYGG